MSIPIPPDYAVERLATHQDSLVELEHLWDNPSTGPLWWDNRRYVWTRRSYQGTYRGIYGKWPALRNWSGARSGLKKVMSFSPLGRWSEKKPARPRLPIDAVLLPVHDGFVIASSAEQKALKIVHSTFARACLQREIDAQRAVREAAIEKYVPTLLDHGSTSAGSRWMVSTFVPNTNPLHAPLRPRASRRQLWHRWLKDHVLPVLEHLYTVQGVQVLDADEVYARGQALMKGHPLASILDRLAELAGTARPSHGEQKYLRVFLHGDLRPKHIHRDGKQWWLIDWGMAERGDIVWEFLPWQRRQAQASKQSISTFWAWMRGDVEFAQLPKGLRRTLELFLKWQSQWQDLHVTTDGLRYHLLCSLLEEIASCTKTLNGHGPLRYDVALREHVPYNAWVAIKQLYALRLIEEAPANGPVE